MLKIQEMKKEKPKLMKKFALSFFFWLHEKRTVMVPKHTSMREYKIEYIAFFLLKFIIHAFWHVKDQEKRTTLLSINIII